MQKKKTESNFKFIIELVVLFAVVFAATTALMTFVISKDRVSGPSMQPGLQNNDRLFSLRMKTPKHGDIVVLYAPDAVSESYLTKNNATAKDVTTKNGNLYLKGKLVPLKDHELYIKRVIGVAGDTVSAKNNQVYLNGKKLKESYLKPAFEKKEMKEYATAYGLNYKDMKFTSDFNLATQKSTMRKTVPKNSYFVMGDNRFVSHDGRAFGFIGRKNIQSVVVWRYWPLNKMKIF